MIRVVTSLVIAALLLTGCSASAVGSHLDAAEDVLENRVDSMKDAVEGAINPSPDQDASRAVTTTITREEAEAIALEHAGFTADQVTRLRTEYEIDDGVPRYEIQFNEGRWEYDYEINANTGAIISYDRDD